MSDNVESLRKCTRCCEKFPLEDWGKKPNGDYYQYCNACRVDNRAIWHKKPQESKDTCKNNRKLKYAAAKEDRTKCLEKANDNSSAYEESDDDEIFRCRTANSGMKTNARGLVDPKHPWVCREIKNEAVCSGCGNTFRSKTNVRVHVEKNRCKGMKPEV